ASSLTTEPLQLAVLLPSLALAWLITFTLMFAIGALAFFITRAMGLFNLYFIVFTLLSGYLMPIKMLPEPIASIAEWLPFRFMISFPVELMTERIPGDRLAMLLLVQLGWAIGTLLIATFVWRRGIRRFEAVGS
ncbi:MAG: ABC-2 family transporter protein, partial [Deltaproteobacteria bacterium]|nr:ABC-2 family transporter protein [Deltaproteobacteria bacterium]